MSLEIAISRSLVLLLHTGACYWLIACILSCIQEFHVLVNFGDNFELGKVQQ